MVVFRSRVAAAVIVFAVFLLFGLIGSAVAQGIQQTPYSAANQVRGLGPFGGLGSAPSNPLGLPGSAYGVPAGSDSIPLSSGMLGCFLPRIPNLEFGFLYNFGKNLRSGRFTADYVLPVNLSSDSVLFGEAHAEGWDFWKKPTVSVVAAPGFTVTTAGTSNRLDLSFGGGYRKMLGEGLLLGANAFYDSSRLFNKWYSSGGIGMEMAATVGGDDAIDVNFNWYGNLFSRNGFINAFRNRGGSFDVEAGYSHALFDHTLDLRLKVAGYQFDVGQRVSGWRGGADFTTRDGMFAVRYEHGQDPINGSYDTVGGFVNIGFQLENVLKGESPFTMPEPVFKSPRNLGRMLTQKVKRNWHQPAAVLIAQAAQSQSPAPSRLFSTVVAVPLVRWNHGVVVAVSPTVPQTVMDTATSMTVTISGFDNVTGSVKFYSTNSGFNQTNVSQIVVNLVNGQGTATFTSNLFWNGANAGPITGIMQTTGSPVLTTGTPTMTIDWY